jgi:hypothetical protein
MPHCTMDAPARTRTYVHAASVRGEKQVQVRPERAMQGCTRVLALLSPVSVAWAGRLRGYYSELYCAWSSYGYCCRPSMSPPTVMLGVRSLPSPGGCDSKFVDHA